MNRPLTHSLALGSGFLVGFVCRKNHRSKAIDTPNTNELERQLEEACRQVVATMRREGQTTEAAAFIAAQAAWQAYRDAEVLALYPPDVERGEGAKLRRDGLRAELAQDRLRQLRR